MNWLSWVVLLLLKDILDMKYSSSDVVGSQGALVHWLLIRVRVLDLQMCSWGQQHYHLWWSRNLAIWAAPLHYLVDLDGEKDQAVKKMETPSTNPCPGQPWCLHTRNLFNMSRHQFFASPMLKDESCITQDIVYSAWNCASCFKRMSTKMVFHSTINRLIKFGIHFILSSRNI